MSALLGERDHLIMNTVPRYSAPLDRALQLTASATVFQVSFAGVATPESITFAPLLLGAVGDISFSSEPAVPLTMVNGDAVLKFSDMMPSVVTVSASAVIEGVTYYARQTVMKQQALDLRPPPAPTGLAATGTAATIVLHWDQVPAQYVNLSHIEVWRATVNSLAQAALIGRADGREYIDPVGPGATRYYWIRYVSRASIPGPYNANGGTVGASDIEVEHLLDVLTGQIRKSQLYAELGQKIDLIDDLALAVGDTVAAAISASQAAQSAADANGSAASANSAAGVATQAATTAGQSAGAAVQSSQSASSAASSAAGSASSAATAVLQAQAILNDPVTGLVDQVAVVKQTLQATADTANGVAAKYSVQMDVGGVVGGIELLGGGGRIDFGVRASTFFIAGPAGSAVPSAVPFIVRTTETVIDGVTIPIGVYIANAFIQNAAITNAKIGGDIWSSNFVAGSDGWRLYRSGDMEINNLHARGAIAGGAFTSYAWPSNGTGFYLGPLGLLLGNARTGGYVEISSSGDIYMPGFSIVNRIAIFSGALSAVTGTFQLVRSPGRSGPAGVGGSGAGYDLTGTGLYYYDGVNSLPCVELGEFIT